MAIALLLTACGGSSDPVQSDDDPTVLEFTDHREIRLTFQTEGVERGGTLYLPLGVGPFPTVGEHQGSSWTARSTWGDVGGLVTAANVTYFSFDRRGHGGLGGSSENLSMDDYAGDLAAATRAAESLTEWVRSDAIGLLGGSFDANHELIAGGTICQEDGEQVDFATPMLAWLGERGFLP